MSGWATDDREIRSVKLAGNGTWYHWGTGDRFERFERAGEYCMLPWIRVTTWKPGYETAFEAPLTQVEFIEVDPAQGIEAATAGETVKQGSTEGESPVGLPMRPNSGATS